MTAKVLRISRNSSSWFVRILTIATGLALAPAQAAQASTNSSDDSGGETPCVRIREIVLDGTDSEWFGWVIDRPSNFGSADNNDGKALCLGVNGINELADRAQRKLLERGYVTSRILFQPQDLSAGRLTLTLIQGRIRAIRFADPDDSRVTVWNALPAQPGDILNLRDIEQALENFKRVPTAEADIKIEPAEAPDESDLVISWKQSLPFRVTLSVDDSGTRSTGKFQGSATLSLDHLWTLNDLFYVTVNHDLPGGKEGTTDADSNRGTRGYVAHYSLPWDYWLLGLTSSSSHYHQNVPGYTQDYVYSGISESADVKLSRLIYRDASPEKWQQLKGWFK